jgi:hypothetical protein
LLAGAALRRRSAHRGGADVDGDVVGAKEVHAGRNDSTGVPSAKTLS